MSRIRTTLVLIAALAIACTTETQPTAPTAGPAVRLSVSPSELGLLIKSIESVSARAIDASGRTTQASLMWSSADPTIASIDPSRGVVTAISPGSTTLTVSAGTLSATVTVTVIEVVGTIAFARGSTLSLGAVTYEVASYSGSDRSVQFLPRRSEFPSIGAPAWSPDGTLLAVEVIRDAVADPDERGTYYKSDLYVLPAATPLATPWRALTANGQSRGPSWSPDGARIAYVQGPMFSDSQHIYVIDAGGGQPTRLTATAGSYGNPRWSPDGRRLLFSNGRIGNGDLFIVNADGSGLTNLTQSPVFEGQASWSPDERRLVFVSTRDTDKQDLFVVDVDGKNLRRLTRSGWSSGPVWSPDSRYIAFSHYAGNGVGGIYVMSADGSLPVRVTYPPAGSADGSAVWKR